MYADAKVYVQSFPTSSYIPLSMQSDCYQFHEVLFKMNMIKKDYYWRKSETDIRRI